ncbi:V-type ATP synthase subunit I [Pseudoramibacter faecis]|uniref:V-type ATP synthase subunit I n=1 Tax=Pseudoramibacter faecis TaxID=3108534 RepID=UPI002E77B9AE|nr:V-type ATP synthase subunit I [Pseudoramibacter sp. HA2172]
MIIPMSKARLIVLKEDLPKILMALQRTGEFMAVAPDETETLTTDSQTASKAQDAAAMLKFLRRHTGKRTFFEDQPQISYETFTQRNERGEKIQDKLEAATARISELHNRISNLESQVDTLQPWKDLNVDLLAVKDTSHVRVLAGYLPIGLEEEASAMARACQVDLQFFGAASEGKAALAIQYVGDQNDFEKQFRELGFVDVNFPRKKGSPQDLISENKTAIAQCQEQIEEIQNQIMSFAEDEKDLALLSEQYEAQLQREEVVYVQSEATTCLYGWVCEDRVDKVKQAIGKVTTVFDLSLVEPEEGEMPPTVTRNPRFWAQFETITDMFSKPQPGELDPALVAGPWYWVIFGMMMGDVGYGACMAVLFFAAKKLMKPKGDFAKLINVLFYSSATTILFGVLFGSYFGETWHPLLFAPLNQPMKMLIFTMIVGVLHMFSGMGIKIAEQVKAGHWLDAIFDQVSWIVLIIGLGLLFVPALATIGKIMAILGAMVILLTAGRDRSNIFGKIAGGLLGLYDISSYLSDILSYSRILALSLATGVIGMVMNLLAHMVAVNPIGWIAAIFIYLIGHVFNLAMSLLSAYVHDSRLQYIEFFNRFYQGGGIPFKPLSIQSKYVNVK